MNNTIHSDIKNAPISDVYKKALTAAYEYSITDEQGYWKKSTEEIIQYLLFNTHEVPEKPTSGINFDKLVDPEAPWDDIDERILNLLLAKGKVDYRFFSWLESKVMKRLDDPIFKVVSELIQKKGLCNDDWELCTKVLENDFYILLSYSDNAVTDFGKALMKFDFDDVWKYALGSKDVKTCLPQLYVLLKKEDKEQFEKQSDRLFDDIVKISGLKAALKLIRDEQPKKVIAMALKEGDASTCKRMAYETLFYARKNNQNVDYFKEKFSEIYLKFGVGSSRDTEYILDEMDDDGLVLLRTITDVNAGMFISAMKKIDTVFKERACDIYVSAFCQDWDEFDKGYNYVKSHKAYLKGVFELLGKYDYSEYLPQIFDAALNINKFDKKTVADLLSSTPAVVQAYIYLKLDNGSKAEKGFAKSIVNRIKKSEIRGAKSKEIDFVVPAEIKLNLERFINSLGRDIFSNIDRVFKNKKTETTFNKISGKSAGEDFQFYFHSVFVIFNESEVVTIDYDAEDDYEPENYEMLAPFHMISPWISKTFDLPELADSRTIFSWFPNLAMDMIEYSQGQGVLKGVLLLEEAGYTLSEEFKVSVLEHDYENSSTNVNLSKVAKGVLTDKNAVKAFAEICFDDKENRAIFF